MEQNLNNPNWVSSTNRTICSSNLQAYGVLLVVDSDSLIISHTSENSEDILGINPQQLVGISALSFFPETIANQFLGWSEASSFPHCTFELIWKKPTGQDFPIIATIHKPSPEFILVDIIQTPLNALNTSELFTNTITSIQESSNCSTLAVCFDSLTAAIRQITNFDRVSIYIPFTEQFHKIVAESKVEWLDSFENLFIFSTLITNEDTVPYLYDYTFILNTATPSIKLYPDETPDKFDCCYSILHSFSSDLLNHFKKTDATSILRIPLLVSGKLVGYLEAVNYKELRLSLLQIQNCIEICKSYSNRYVNLLEQESATNSLFGQKCIDEAFKQITLQSNLFDGLVRSQKLMVELIYSDGVVIVSNGSVFLQDTELSETQTNELIQLCASKLVEKTVFTTSNYKETFQEFAIESTPIDSVLACSVKSDSPTFVIWIRNSTKKNGSVIVDGYVERSPFPDNEFVHKTYALERFLFSTKNEFSQNEIELANNFQMRLSTLHTVSTVIAKNFSLELEQIKSELEQRVEERTDEITRANKQLKVEIAERKKIERALRHSKELAEEMNRLKSNFLANMSHEIRTPLNSILGFSQIIYKQADTDDMRSFSSMIQKSGTRLMSLLNSLLEMSRSESQKMEMQIAVCSLQECTNSVLSSFRHLADEKSLYIQEQFSSDHSLALLDGKLLENILVNIIGNAIKFTKFGGVTIRIGTAMLDDDKEWSYVSVADTGVGMDKSFIPKLFTPFVQESTGNARKFEGAGLGLSMAKRYVELMGGKLHVETEKNIGTTIRVMFPIYFPNSKVDETQMPTHSFVPNPVEIPTVTVPKEYQKIETNGTQKQYPQILLVEDNKENAILTKLLLKNICLVDHAENGQEGIHLAQEKFYKLVLMDINLGDSGMDGVDTFHLIRKNPVYTEVPFVAITAYAMEGDKEKFLSHGFTDYLAKPFTRDDLQTIVTKMLERNPQKV